MAKKEHTEAETLTVYSFPTEGITVEARNGAEAREKLDEVLSAKK